MLPQLESFSDAEIGARLGLDRRALKARIAELQHEIVTGEPVMTILAAAAELGISTSSLHTHARKLEIRLTRCSCWSMIAADDFERLRRDRSQVRGGQGSRSL